jgi:hypothetical protein
MYHRIRIKSFSDPDSPLRQRNRKVDIVCSQYEKRASEIVRSYGLPVSTFNTLSHSAAASPSLKKKILLQAYFYKIAADLESNLQPIMPTLPDISAPGQYSLLDNEFDELTGLTYDSRSMNNQPEPEFKRFCKALNSIENERLRIRTELQRDLNLEYLPSTMCDPSTLPAMSKNVQRACAAFPNAASQVIQKNNLDLDRFNELKEKMNNIIFKAKVEMEIRKLNKSSSQSNKNKQSTGDDE